MGKGASILQLVIVILLLALCAVVAWDRFPAPDLYIGDLEELNVVKADWFAPQRNLTVDQKPLMIDDRLYTRGLGVHAESEVSFTVPPGYSRFVADTGVDDEISDDKPASVQFMVLGDGVVLYEGPLMTGTMPPRRVDVSIKGVQQLTLRVLPTPDGNNSDHADWGAARLVSR